MLALVLVGVLFAEMMRSERAQREVTAGALTDYADVAAWQYVRRAEVELRGSLAPALGALAESSPDQSVETLHKRATNAASRCPCPHGLQPGLTFRLDNGRLEYSGNDALLDRVALMAHLEHKLEHGNNSQEQQRGLHFLSFNGRATTVAHVANGSSQPGILGYLADIEPVRSALSDVFDRDDLLPASLLADRKQSDLLTLRVIGADETLYQSGPLDGPWRGRASFDSISESFSGLTVETALPPIAAEYLIVGGTPRSRLPLLGALTLVALVLGAVAGWQVLAERRLARMRTDTIARISHELRTPLAQIRLFADTLRLGRVREERERERALNVIDRESRRLDHLVGNVLHFGRRDAGAETVNRSSIALNEFLEKVKSEYLPLASHQGVEIDVSPSGSLQVHADQEALRHMLLNLLDNAAKHSPEGASVRLSAKTADCGRHVLICVDDAGPGVPVSRRDDIWEMYRRASDGATSGSGIGLAVVRHYARQLGGEAWVEDAPEGGARFVIELPASNKD